MNPIVLRTQAKPRSAPHSRIAHLIECAVGNDIVTRGFEIQKLIEVRKIDALDSDIGFAVQGNCMGCLCYQHIVIVKIPISDAGRSSSGILTMRSEEHTSELQS